MSNFTKPTLALAKARKYAIRNMQSTVRISRMAKPTEFEEDDWTNHAVVTRIVYEGVARIYSVSGGADIDFGDEIESFSTSYISTPITVNGDLVDTQVDDLIEVLTNLDPRTRYRVFRVLDVDGGGQYPVVRRHQVQGVQRFREWTYVDEPDAG